jgi:hypothetical protein
MLLFWPASTWFETVRVVDKRRPDRPRERQVLSEPSRILSAETCFGLDRKPRTLFRVASASAAAHATSALAD